MVHLLFRRLLPWRINHAPSVVVCLISPSLRYCSSPLLLIIRAGGDIGRLTAHLTNLSLSALISHPPLFCICHTGSLRLYPEFPCLSIRLFVTTGMLCIFFQPHKLFLSIIWQQLAYNTHTHTHTHSGNHSLGRRGSVTSGWI